MFRNPSPLSLMLVGVAALSLCGCNGGGKKRLPMAKAHGTVHYKGEPVADAMVTFHMEGTPRSAVGKTDANGHFDLTTYDMDDGAFIGSHKVTVSKIVISPLGKKPEDGTPEDLAKLTREGKLKEMLGSQKGAIPAVYTDIKTTPLQFTIEQGENDKSIQLKD